MINDNEEIIKDSESEEEFSKKKIKTLKEIEEENQKLFNKKINKVQEEMNSCIYLESVHKSKHPYNHSALDPPCYNCGRASIWDVNSKSQNKKGFELEKTIHICQKEFDKKIQFCLNPQMPFLIAPCNYFRNRQQCINFDSNPKSKKDFLDEDDGLITEWKENCKNLIKLEFQTISDNENIKCNICNKKAIKKAKYPIKLNHKIKEIYVCERHSKMPYACISDIMPFLLAPCLLLEDNEYCIAFTH